MTACSGCRELRKRCSQGDQVCPLRDAMSELDADEEGVKAATASVSKCLGRKTFLDMIGGMPSRHRPALFESLLVEACGRYLNPVSGVVGILASGNWDLLREMVDKVLKGRTLTPKEFPYPSTCVEPPPGLDRPWPLQNGYICSPATPRENALARDRIRSAILSGMEILEQDLAAEFVNTGKKSKVKKKTKGRLEGEDDCEEMTDFSSENLSATQGLELGVSREDARIRAVEVFTLEGGVRKRHIGALNDDLGGCDEGTTFINRNCASSLPRGSSCAESSNGLQPGSFSVNYDTSTGWADQPMAETKRARANGGRIPGIHHNSMWEFPNCLAHDKAKLNEHLKQDDQEFVYSSVPGKAIQVSHEGCSDNPQPVCTRRAEVTQWDTTDTGPELELFPGANRDSRPRDSGPPSSPTSGESVNIADLARNNYTMERFQHSRQELSLSPFNVMMFGPGRNQNFVFRIWSSVRDIQCFWSGGRL